MNSIEKLVSVATGLAVRPVAQGREEAEKWSSDFEEYTRARMKKVSLLSNQHQALVVQALEEWAQRENYFLNGLDKEAFFSIAKAGREELKATGRLTNFECVLWGERNARTTIVPEIDWIHAFTWIMPLADPKNASKFKQAGLMMATIMELEAMLKWPGSVAKCTFLRSLADIKPPNACS